MIINICMMCNCCSVAAVVDWQRANDENDLNFQIIRLKWRTFTVEYNPKEVPKINQFPLNVFLNIVKIGWKLKDINMLLPHVLFLANIDASHASGRYHWSCIEAICSFE